MSLLENFRTGCHESDLTPVSHGNQDKTQGALLTILIVAFLGLSLLYSTTVPIFEPQDEEAHFQLSKHFATKMRLPDYRKIDDLQSAGYQAHQTPLYYFFQGILLRISGNSQIAFTYKENPFRSGGTPGFYYHNQPGEKFPYAGKYLLFHLLRFTNVIAGVLTLLVIYKTVRLMSFQQSALPLAATSLVALMPQFTYLCGSWNNDVFSVLFASLTFFFLIRFLLDPNSSSRLVVLMSASVGLATLSKQMALSLIPVCYLAALIKGNIRRKAVNILTLTVVLSVFIGWYYARNWFLFHDLFNLRVQFEQLSPILTQKKNLSQFTFYFFNYFIQLFSRSFWGSFGYMTIWMSWNMYFFYSIIAGLGILSFAIGMLGPSFRARFSKEQKIGLMLFGAAFVLIMAEVLSYNFSLSQPQGRYGFPWLCGLAVFWSLGMERVVTLKEKQKNWFSLSLIGLFALVNLHVLSITVRSAFPPPPTVVDVVQNQYQTTMGEIRNTVVGQLFHCNIEGLDQVAVRFTTFGRYNNCHIVFHLRDRSNPSKDLVTIELPAIDVKNDSFYTFKFTPLENSKGREYFFAIESPDGRKDHALGCYYTFLDSYPGGTAFVDNRPLPGDLTFITGRT